jgi:dihydrofolate synthase/folylpolyglutamate synthase
MRALVRGLGHPERSFKSVLIAGTNGKGSVSAYLDAALRAASLRVGRYTSPHLIDIRERITVSGRDISNRDFERLVLEVRHCSNRLVKNGLIENHPNHFEILTAVAFLHFQRSAVDIAVLEVGLGGRLDATNVASPEVSAIVSIDFDHEEYLGRTLSAIASEKAGVTRKGRVTVLGPMDEEAERTIIRKARAAGAKVVHANAGVTAKAKRRGLDVRTPIETYRGLKPLPGDHQRTNLVVAIRTLEGLRSTGVPLNLPEAVAAMSGAFWPGRLERFEGRHPVLLDGAHNPAGARALARYLRSAIGPHILVFGAMRDKHVDEMAEMLFPLARLVIATRVRMTRAASTAQLKAIGSRLRVDVVEQPSIGPALAHAVQQARRGETIVVAGSLYLVGAARRRLLVNRR